MENKLKEPHQVSLGPDRQRTFFLDHLNRIYCIKSHLAQRLPAMTTHAAFADLRHAITETLEDIERQIVRMKEIYTILDVSFPTSICGDLNGYAELTFSEIQIQIEDRSLRDMSILFYLQNMESMEMASFQVLSIIANKMEDTKQIKQLLTENYDEAKEDRALLLAITAQYLKN